MSLTLMIEIWALIKYKDFFFQYRKSHVGAKTVSHKIVLSPQWGFLYTAIMQLHSSGQLCEVWQTTWFGTSVMAGYDFNSMKSR